MPRWALVENLAIYLACVSLIIFAPGWWKLSAFVVLSCLNCTQPRSR